MRHYYFQIHDERGTEDDPVGVVLSGPGAAMLHAVTMCAEIGCSSGFFLSYSVCVRDEHGAEVGRVAVVLAADAGRYPNV